MELTVTFLGHSVFIKFSFGSFSRYTVEQALKDPWIDTVQCKSDLAGLEEQENITIILMIIIIIIIIIIIMVTIAK